LLYAAPASQILEIHALIEFIRVKPPSLEGIRVHRNEEQKSSIAGDGSSSLKADETSTRQLGRYEGTVLDGRYLIERELGRGGIGVVYLARDQQLISKPVVIKILLEQVFETDSDGWVKKKFRQEVEALARIDHPRASSACSKRVSCLAGGLTWSCNISRARIYAQ